MIDTTHEAPDLLPCPFCGGEATHNDGGNSTYGRFWWCVGCENCDVWFMDKEVWRDTEHGRREFAYPPKHCFKEWNTRSDDLVQAAVAAALREAADYAGTLQDFGREEAIEAAILALITPEAQAALDRVVAAALREAINRVNGCDRISEVQPAILSLIRERGE